MLLLKSDMHMPLLNTDFKRHAAQRKSHIKQVPEALSLGTEQLKHEAGH
jgi:hypothetical protein